MKVTRFEDAKALRAPAEGGMTDYDFREFEIRHKILNELQAPESGEADAALRALVSYHEVCAIVVDEVALIRWGCFWDGPCMPRSISKRPPSW
jgi:hypothetical protein